jgi:hypothetical protein
MTAYKDIDRKKKKRRKERAVIEVLYRPAKLRKRNPLVTHGPAVSIERVAVFSIFVGAPLELSYAGIPRCPLFLQWNPSRDSPLELSTL